MEVSIRPGCIDAVQLVGTDQAVTTTAAAR